MGDGRTAVSGSRWVELHDESSVLAQEAWLAGRHGDPDRARTLYLGAGEREAAAYEALPAAVTRSRGILAISLVSLLTKGGDERGARSWATRLLGDPGLPEWASVELRSSFLLGEKHLPEATGDHGDLPKEDHGSRGEGIDG